MLSPSGTQDFDAATPAIQGLVDKGTRFVAVSGIGLLAPGDTGQLHDGGPSAAHFTGPRVHRNVPDAGHNLPQEAPVAFADAIRAVASLGLA